MYNLAKENVIKSFDYLLNNFNNGKEILDTEDYNIICNYLQKKFDKPLFLKLLIKNSMLFIICLLC